MQTWAKTTLARMAAKYKRNIPYAVRDEMIPYGGAPNGFIAAPFDGNSWWTGGFWPGLM